MSLAHRIIPTVLCRGRVLVKGEGFNAWRSCGLVAQAVRIHQARGVDELILLDIAATAEGRGPDLALIEELTAECFMPLAVGGGIRSVKDVQALLRAGADKVVVNSGAIEVPNLIQDICHIVGSQAIVASIDVKDGSVYGRNATRLTKFSPTWWALRLQARGAGEIMITSVVREGTMAGYDLQLVRNVAHALHIPVIAHGGCGSYEHMKQALEAGASAVAAGAMFQFQDATPKGAAQYLAQHGHEVRI